MIRVGSQYDGSQWKVRLGKTIYIAATIDERFLTPLTVVLHSAGRRLSAGWKLHVFVIADGISSDRRREMDRRLAGAPIEVEWLRLELSPEAANWRDADRTGGMVYYYRLFLGDALPESVTRVLFLDADLLVEGDLAELWALPFDGKTVQAAPDAYSHLYHVHRLQRLSLPDGGGFSAESKYFNAGVLLIDLAQWRKKDVGRRAMELLGRCGERFTFRDQDALNCVLVGDWKPLPITWNFHELPTRLGFWRSDESREALKATFRRPRIIHFVGDHPWEPGCLNRRLGRWQDAAREVGLAQPQPNWIRRALLDAFAAAPAELDWRLWRGVVHATDAWQLRQAGYLVAACPWLPATYPLWKIWVRAARWRRRRIGKRPRPALTGPKEAGRSR